MIQIENTTQYLAEWIVRHIKNKDLILRRIETVKEEEDKITVNLKDGRQHIYIVEPFMKDAETTLAKLTGNELSTIVVYNTKENFDILLKGWEKFVKFSRHLSIYFVNQFSTLEKKWIIYPHTHDRISEKQALKSGLSSLFNTVEPITENKIREILK